MLIFTGTSCRDAPDSTPPKPFSQAFYLWQYTWSPEVSRAALAVTRQTPEPLYVVAGEIGAEAVPAPDWPALAACKTGVVPVIRVYAESARQLETAPAQVADLILAAFAKLQSRAAKAGIQVAELQLDLDCPERLLPDYGKCLRVLRPQLNGIALTITALPCHVANTSFSGVIDAVDGYTLQLHGVELPQSVHDPVSIIDLSIAKRALIAADRIDKPYLIALPTYAYSFVFDRDTGRSVGLLQPFSPRPNPRTRIVRTVAPDPETLRHIHRLAQRSSSCTGVIWFRMPVEGERACWTLDTVTALHNDQPVDTRIATRWHTAKDGRMELMVINQANLTDRTAVIALEWPDRHGDYGLLAAEPFGDRHIPGQMPARMLIQLPPPGASTTAAWFRTEKPPRVTLNVGKP